MFVIMSGMIIAFFLILNSFPENVNFNNALKLAGLGGKMEIVDFSFDIEKKYTVNTSELNLLNEQINKLTNEHIN